MFESLSEEGRSLLEEIIKSQEEQEKAFSYWKDRFNGLSCSEDYRLRSIFREVADAGLIETRWADNCPFYISITNVGHNYFKNEKEYQKLQKRLSIREWKISIVSAIAGSLVGLIPYILTMIGR